MALKNFNLQEGMFCVTEYFPTLLLLHFLKINSESFDHNELYFRGGLLNFH